MGNLAQLILIVTLIISAVSFMTICFKQCTHHRVLLCYLIPVFLIILITGCSSGKTTPQNTKPASETNKNITPPVKQSETPAPTEKVPADSQSKVKSPNGKNLLKPASEGKMDGVEFKIGSSYKEITDMLGNPKNKSTFNGGEVLTYGDASYIITPDTKVVVGIMVKNGKTLYGVKVGMKTSDIKKVLGNPDFEGEDEMEGMWNLSYKAGDNTVLFTAVEKDGPTNIAILQSSTF